MPYYHYETTDLSESQLSPSDEGCPICGNKDRSKMLRVQEAPDVWLLNCRKCHVSSASRMPTDKTLETYYSEYYSAEESEESASEEDKITFDKPTRLVNRIRSGITNSFEGRRVEIMDFGGGDGTIAYMLGKTLLEENACKEVRVVVVDSSVEVPQNNDSRIVVENRTRLEDDGEHYDVVIASAILEHIPYPTEVLRTLLSSLGTGGVFYARTPFVLPLLRLLPVARIRKVLFSYPWHVHDMGQHFWENILDELELLPEYRMLQSRPSPVERSLGQDFFRASAAHLLKAPWYVFGKRYGLVGGWEVVIEKCA